MNKILVIAEHDNKKLKPSNLHVMTAATELDSDIDFMVVGHGCRAVAEQASRVDGVKKILLADHEVYQSQLAENTASLIADIAKDYSYILCAAGTFGKNLLPRVAALMDRVMISDISKIIDGNTFERPIYAGNVIATVQSQVTDHVISVRATAFSEAPAGHGSASIESVDKCIPNELTTFVSQELTQSSRPELTNAKVVVSGGRGLKSAENFKMIEALADQLNAAIGASRAAVDAGFAPNDYQVGQTGKIVAPQLYIAIGISGAIQHMAGMKDSKIIVAINNDPEAPIFEEADYGIVGDLFIILPELQSELKKMQAA